MSARDEVLARVRAALRAEPSGEVPPPDAPSGTPVGEPERDGRPHPRPAEASSGAFTTSSPVDDVVNVPFDGVADDVVPRAYRVTGDLGVGSAEVVDLLEERLVDYAAVVHRAGSDAEVARIVADVVGRTVVVPDGLDDSWLADVPADATSRDSRAAPIPATDLDAATGVVTACRVAIAETGTIVLDGEPDQGRRAISLVPDLHVCVVRTEQVVHLVPEAVRLLGVHAERPQTWISGPSATSDIELSRVEGVHGPRRLHVVLLGQT